MSQKALKKKELLNLQRQERQYQLYQHQHQYQHQQQQQQSLPSHIDLFVNVKNSIDHTNNNNLVSTKNRFSSTPNINATTATTSSLSRVQTGKVSNFYGMGGASDDQSVQRGHSETDITKIPENKILVNAKSEFHLKSIASSQVPMTTGARREADGSVQRKPVTYNKLAAQRKKAGDGPRVGSVASNRSESSQMHGSQCGFADTEHIRIPIIGYEVMEERARFTVSQLEFYSGRSHYAIY